MNINESLPFFTFRCFFTFSSDFTRMVTDGVGTGHGHTVAQCRQRSPADVLVLFECMTSATQRCHAPCLSEGSGVGGSFTTGRLLISCEATDSWCFSKI